MSVFTVCTACDLTLDTAAWRKEIGKMQNATHFQVREYKIKRLKLIFPCFLDKKKMFSLVGPARIRFPFHAAV